MLRTWEILNADIKALLDLLENKSLCMASHLWFAKGPQGIVMQSDGNPLLRDSCKQKQVAKLSGESVFQNPVTSTTE